MNKSQNKVLAIFGNVVNMGQERSNIEVFKLLKNSNLELLVLVNKRCFHWHLQPSFDKLELSYKKIWFPWGIYKTSGIKHICQWMYDLLRNNVQFIYYYYKFRPNYIHIGNEYMMTCLLIPLLLVRAKIIFRLGDEPVVNNMVRRYIWKKITQRVDKFVCVSKFIQDKLRNAGRKNSQNDYIIYNFPPTRFNENAEEKTYNNQSFTIGFIGQICENKGVHLLLDAAIKLCNKYNNIEFIFAGALNDNTFYETKIHPILNTLNSNIRHRIRFLGNIDHVANFYNSIDIHVAPSIYREALGNVVVEAKKYHKASIVFPTGGMPELVEHKQSGYICKGKNIENLIEAFEYYIQNYPETILQGEKAYASINSLKIGFDDYKRKWRTVYDL